MYISRIFYCSLLVPLIAGFASTVPAQVPPTACKFDAKRLAFQGSALEQARCLMRTVQKGGQLGQTVPLPKALEDLIGNKPQFDKAAFETYVLSQGVNPKDLGGSVQAELSRAEGADKPLARYFVLHDTSWNVCADVAKFDGADLPNKPWNDAGRWSDNKQAHLFITRDGKLVAPQGRTFAVPWRATQLEQIVGTASRGLFLHVEHVQLRRAELLPGQSPNNAKGECRNDRLAQMPGFSPVQTDRSTLTYIAASLRRGEWLIPASHAILDEGIKSGHDDPQNFDIKNWTKSICRHLTKLNHPCTG